MSLYSKNGGYPQPLPDRDYSGDGLAMQTWTDLAHNAAGREACGWVEAPDAPVIDTEAASLAWVDGAWAVEPFSAARLADQLATARAARLAELAALRWQTMQSLLWLGSAMPGDDTTVGRCMAAVDYATRKGLDLDQTRSWKVVDGVWIDISTRQIGEYGDAIGDHWVACFEHERALSDQLVAAPDLATLRAIDIASGWPA